VLARRRLARAPLNVTEKKTQSKTRAAAAATGAPEPKRTASA